MPYYPPIRRMSSSIRARTLDRNLIAIWCYRHPRAVRRPDTSWQGYGNSWAELLLNSFWIDWRPSRKYRTISFYIRWRQGQFSWCHWWASQ